MSNLVSIEDLGRPVTPDEYIVVYSKTAISVELLFKTLPYDAADKIMRVLIRGMAERLHMDPMTLTHDVCKANNAMAFAGFFRSQGFKNLVQQTIDQGQPDDEEAHRFFQYVCDNAVEAATNVPPAGTTIN